MYMLFTFFFPDSSTNWVVVVSIEHFRASPTKKKNCFHATDNKTNNNGTNDNDNYNNNNDNNNNNNNNNNNVDW